MRAKPTPDGVPNGVPPQGQTVPNGMFQPDETSRADANIRAAYDYVLTELKSRGQAFVEDFPRMIYDSDDSVAQEMYDSLLENGVDLLKACEPLSNRRTILHQIVSQVNEHALDPDVASDIMRILVQDWPSLIRLRSDADVNLNALELAAASENCLELIKAICEYGMVMDVTPTPEHDIIEPNPEDPNQQSAIPSTSISTQKSSSIHDMLNAQSSNPRIMKKDGRSIEIVVEWRQLTQADVDTCLHIAIRRRKDDYASYLLDRMYYTDGHQHILRHKGQSGLTPLHLAVDSAQSSSGRLELVKKIMDLYPDALAMESGALPHEPEERMVNGGTVRKENLTPYKYFVESKAATTNNNLNRSVIQPASMRGNRQRRPPLRKMVDAQSNAQPSKDVKDQSAIEDMDKLLRLGCMRYFGRNRELITRLLGKPDQIHLDLNPREEVTQQFFDYMSTIKFEPYLQYVYIPNLRVRDVKNEEPRVEREPWWRSKSRKDYFYIFSWLKTSRRVKRILSLVVKDDPVNFHGDEVIEEAVKEFDIETWDWMKPDMCSDTILAAAKNVRDLTLHWSGNRAVLNSWSAPKGLASLRKLELIRIKTPESIESGSRFADLRSKFVTKLTTSWEQEEWRTNPPKVDWEIVATQKQTTKRLSEREKSENYLKEQWLSCMDEFSQTVTTYLVNRKDKEGKPKGLDSNEVVKVAIIDDGVYPDRDGIGDHIDGGETFYDNEGHWPGHYQSTYGHGHLMACLVKRLCPRVKLYVAKLNELWRDGRSQITSESAAEAIHWAIGKQVDIISMSWTIETPQEDAKTKLNSAVDEALNKDILLFCASDDHGNLNKIPYPASIDKRIFWIGSATALGRPNDETQTGVMFIAPGTDDMHEAPYGDSLSPTKPRVGSSIATARCAGLAALILQCILLAPDGYSRNQIRKEGNMRKSFARMTGDQTDQRKYLRVWDVFKEAKKRAGIEDEFNIISYVASTFLKDVPVEEINVRKSF